MFLNLGFELADAAGLRGVFGVTARRTLKPHVGGLGDEHLGAAHDQRPRRLSSLRITVQGANGVSEARNIACIAFE